MPYAVTIFFEYKIMQIEYFDDNCKMPSFLNGNFDFHGPFIIVISIYQFPLLPKVSKFEISEPIILNIAF